VKKMMGKSSGLDPQRAAEVMATNAAGNVERGSGYLVTSQLVLTAAHVIAGAVSIRVRFDADQDKEWTADVETRLSDLGADIALLSIVESSIIPPRAELAVKPAVFGRILRPPVDCEAVGFPLFKLRDDRMRPGADGLPSQYRDSKHATGTATTWSNRREGTMEVRVDAPERDPDPQRSPWEGMSGAAVFGGDYLIGVIGKHHRSDGLGTLAAYPIERWYERLTGEQISSLTELIGLPDKAASLMMVLPTDIATVELRRLQDDKVDRGRQSVQQWGATLAHEQRWDWHSLGHALVFAHEALELDRDYQRPWTLLADVYHRLGRTPLAKMCLARSRTLATPGPNWPGRFWKGVDSNLRTGYPFNAAGGLHRQQPPDWFIEKYERYLEPDTDSILSG
jgi:hypothetical protein